DQFDSAAEIAWLGLHLQGALEAVDHRQQRLDGVHGGVVAEVLLLFTGAAASVFKLSLRAGQAIKQRVALRLQLLQFVFGACGFASWRRSNLVAISGRKFVL